MSTTTVTGDYPMWTNGTYSVSDTITTITGSDAVTGMLTVTSDNTWTVPVTYTVPYVPGTSDLQPAQYGQYVPFKFEDLEEGVHDIPGGKVIIKKVMAVTKEIEDSLFESEFMIPTELDEYEGREI